MDFWKQIKSHNTQVALVHLMNNSDLPFGCDSVAQNSYFMLSPSDHISNDLAHSTWLTQICPQYREPYILWPFHKLADHQSCNQLHNKRMNVTLELMTVITM